MPSLMVWRLGIGRPPLSSASRSSALACAGALAGSAVPDGAAAKRITARALERGLIVLTCGTYGETIRILTPLTIADGDLKDGLQILCDAILND